MVRELEQGVSVSTEGSLQEPLPDSDKLIKDVEDRLWRQRIREGSLSPEPASFSSLRPPQMGTENYDEIIAALPEIKRFSDLLAALVDTSVPDLVK